MGIERVELFKKQYTAYHVSSSTAFNFLNFHVIKSVIIVSNAAKSYVEKLNRDYFDI